MTQARDRQALRVQLTPMQIPEAVPNAGLAISGSMATDASAQGPSLVLHPGEPSEMVVQVKNLGVQTQRIELRVEGAFPTQWYRVGMEGQELAPGQQMDAVLYFQIPATFFEEQEALRLADRLNIDYQSRLCVYYASPASRGIEQVDFTEFSLHIRPRSLYLDFLPVIYREVDFIGRFLKIFEQAFEPAVQSLDAMWANLDPLTAPQSLLPFLAYWVAWPLDPRWDLARQRRLIRNAVELYRWRGTRRGLRLYLHYYTGLPLDDHIPRETDKHISITEPSGQGFVLGGTRLGQDSVLGGGRPYHFMVRLRPERENQIDERLVRRILVQEKPAFCTYELMIAKPPENPQNPQQAPNPRPAPNPPS
jgi:phage tail-like protein